MWPFGDQYVRAKRAGVYTKVERDERKRLVMYIDEKKHAFLGVPMVTLGQAVKKGQIIGKKKKS